MQHVSADASFQTLRTASSVSDDELTDEEYPCSQDGSLVRSALLFFVLVSAPLLTPLPMRHLHPNGVIMLYVPCLATQAPCYLALGGRNRRTAHHPCRLAPLLVCDGERTVLVALDPPNNVASCSCATSVSQWKKKCLAKEMSLVTTTLYEAARTSP